MTFDLWRQDDNGRRFLVARHATHDGAEKQLAELTRVPHKQIYWIVDGNNTEPRRNDDD